MACFVVLFGVWVGYHKQEFVACVGQLSVAYARRHCCSLPVGISSLLTGL